MRKYKGEEWRHCAHFWVSFCEAKGELEHARAWLSAIVADARAEANAIGGE